MAVPAAETADPRSRRAYRFIFLLGLVSLFADATYESARSVLGQFLATLGATGTSVGLVAGLGELINNGLRILSGHVSDRTRRPWRITFVGFGLNMMAVPLLALATTPAGVAALWFAERTGKAIRNPPRDAMLSNAASCIGNGRGFGAQEALGQIGAAVGPLLIAVLIARGHGYRFALEILAIPALLTLVVLGFSRALFPEPGQIEAERAGLAHGGTIPRSFWLLVAGAALSACGYLHFPLIGYALVKREMSETWIPPLYALAMATQALGALGAGHLFDRQTAIALVGAVVVAAPVAVLAFVGGDVAVVVAIVLWGVGLGAQKATFKAAISTLVPAERRATAYGAFFAAYGVALFVGNLVMGRLHDSSVPALVAFSLSAELLAVPFVFAVARRVPKHAPKAAPAQETCQLFEKTMTPAQP